MKYLFLIMSVTLFLGSCKNEPTTKPQAKKTGLPALPVEKFQYLAQNCDYVDYIFYDLPFSLSQSEPEAIRTNLQFLSQDAWGEIGPECGKAMGREFFHVKGEIVMEAELYFNDKCKFYVFMEDQKPVFTSVVTPGGVNFYNNIFAQVMKSAPNQGQ